MCLQEGKDYFGSASIAQVYASTASEYLPALKNSLPLPLTSPTTLHVPPICNLVQNSQAFNPSLHPLLPMAMAMRFLFQTRNRHKKTSTNQLQVLNCFINGEVLQLCTFVHRETTIPRRLRYSLLSKAVASHVQSALEKAGEKHKVPCLLGAYASHAGMRKAAARIAVGE